MDVVKMKQGMSYSKKEKTIILNVFKYFKSCYPDICVTEIVRRTSKATGCSEKSVFQFRKEESSAEGFKQPSKTKIRKNININSRTVKYDENVRQRIRDIIYDLKYKHIIPSLSRILKVVNCDEKLPKFSVMTLRRLLFDMGFSYERDTPGSKPMLVEKSIENSGKKVDKTIKIKKTDNCHQPLKTNNMENGVKSTNPEAVPNSYHHMGPQVSHVQQQNHIFMSNQNHQVLPIGLTQHNLMHNHLQLPHVLSGRTHEMQQIVPGNNLRDSFGYVPHGMIHSENSLLQL